MRKAMLIAVLVAATRPTLASGPGLTIPWPIDFYGGTGTERAAFHDGHVGVLDGSFPVVATVRGVAAATLSAGRRRGRRGTRRAVLRWRAHSGFGRLSRLGNRGRVGRSCAHAMHRGARGQVGTQPMPW